MAVWPYPDRSSPILGDSPRDGRVMGVNRGHMAVYMLFAEALVFSFSHCNPLKGRGVN